MKYNQFIHHLIIALVLWLIYPASMYGNSIEDECWQVEYQAAVSCSPQACWDFYADFLYWRADVVNLPYAVLGNITIEPSTAFAFPNHEFAASVPFQYTPGFRIGIGRQIDCCFDVTADWTRFHTSGHISKVAGPDDLIQIIWTLNFPATIASIAASQSLHYDVVTLDLVNHTPLGSFIFHPCFGAIVAKIDQRLSISTTQLFDDGIVGFDTVNITNDFVGSGPQIGLLLEYMPCRNFTLFTKGMYSLLYGKFNLAVRDVDVVSIIPTATFRHDQETIEFALSHAFDMNIGLRYHWIFSYGQLSFHIDYECVFWPGQVRVPRIQSADLATKNRNADLFNAQGDLCMHGLTTGIEYHY